MTDVDTRIVSSGEDGTHRKNKQTKPKPNQKKTNTSLFFKWVVFKYFLFIVALPL